MFCFSPRADRAARGDFVAPLTRRSQAALALLLLLAASALAQPTPFIQEYSLTLQSLWTEANFNDSYPGVTFWSDMAGLTHSANYTWFSVGALATDGLAALAADGTTSAAKFDFLPPLAGAPFNTSYANYEDAFGGSQAYEPFAVAPNNFDSSGLLFADYRIRATQPMSRLSFALRMAPSPDWFTGVSGLDLWDNATGDWIQSVTVALYPLDAGVCDGTGYTDGCTPTMPADVISQITSGPLATPPGPVAFLTLTAVNSGYPRYYAPPPAEQQRFIPTADTEEIGNDCCRETQEFYPNAVRMMLIIADHFGVSPRRFVLERLAWPSDRDAIARVLVLEPVNATTEPAEYASATDLARAATKFMDRNGIIRPTGFFKGAAPSLGTTCITLSFTPPTTDPIICPGPSRVKGS